MEKKGGKQGTSETGTTYALYVFSESDLQKTLQLLLSMFKYSMPGESQYLSAYLILTYNSLFHFNSSNCSIGFPGKMC